MELTDLRNYRAQISNPQSTPRKPPYAGSLPGLGAGNFARSYSAPISGTTHIPSLQNLHALPKNMHVDPLPEPKKSSFDFNDFTGYAGVVDFLGNAYNSF